MAQTFDILSLDYLILDNLNFETSKVHDIGLQRYKDYKIRVGGKNSVPFK